MAKDDPAPARDIDVFISYKREERALASLVAAALEAEGYTQVTDRNLKNADHFGDEIDRMIRRSRVVLVLWTAASVDSHWVKSEARLGAELGTYLGVMVEPVELPVDLRYVQAEVLEGPAAEGLPQITAAVEARIGPPETTPGDATDRSTGLNDDLMFFQTVQRVATADAFEAYLAAFPNGLMAGMARSEADRLRAEAARQQTLWWRLRQRLPGPALTLTFISTSIAAMGLLLTYAAQPGDPLNVMVENRALRRELAANRATAEDLAAANAARDRLAAQLVAAQESAGEVLGQQDAVDAAQEEVSTLREQLATAATSRDRLAAQLAAAQEALGAAEAQGAALAAAREEVSALEERLAEAAEAQAALAADLEAAARAREAAEARAEGLQAEADLVASLRARLAAAEEKLAALEAPDPPAREAAALPAAPEPDCPAEDGGPGYLIGPAGCVSLATERLFLNLRWVDEQVPMAKVGALSELRTLSILSTTFIPYTNLDDPRHLAKLKYLRTLNLTGSDIETLDPIAGLTNLRSLFLSDTPVTDITPLADLTNLEFLSLAGTNVDDLSPLAGLHALYFLVLPDSTRLGGYPKSEENRREIQDWLDANVR